MKTCAKCKKEYPLDCFAKRKDRKDSLGSYCIECRKKSVDAVAKNRQKRKRLIDEIKSMSACVICGEDDPCCLDFHHKDPSTKEKDIGRMYMNNEPISNIHKEIEKCVVLCANCHRKFHAGRLSLPS